MQILLAYGADLVLVAASLGAAGYCLVLSRRLNRLGSFDKGIGAAIAVLSTQVEEMKSALGEAKAGSDGAGQQLGDLVRQAREISAELEMMIAACHDFAEQAIDVQSGAAQPAPDPTSPDGDDGQEVADEPEPVAVFGSRRGGAAPEREGGAAIPMFRRGSAGRT
jgi:hypothetical protein